MTKEHILSEIKRVELAVGEPPGKRRFETTTGIRESDWCGIHWARWSDALAEAGLEPNAVRVRTPDAVALEKVALLTRALGRVPARGDVRMKRRRDSTFPSEATFEKYGGRENVVSRLRHYCQQNPDLQDVAAICASTLPDCDKGESHGRDDGRVQGEVYLIRSGQHYKIGKTNAVGRRERELQMLLPEQTKRVHSIATDDPSGIENYWHRRFATKRTHGEWFKLDAEDVRAFKRRKYQ